MMKGISLEDIKGNKQGKRGNSPNGAFPTNGFLPQIGNSPLQKNLFPNGTGRG